MGPAWPEHIDLDLDLDLVVGAFEPEFDDEDEREGSRARFAQNERSVFGFLSSAEPAGFQEFLQTTEAGEATYDPAWLWDYLASNFGMALAGYFDRVGLAVEGWEDPDF